MSSKELRRFHYGRNIERIRELRNIKQETLASELGITQQAVSKMEQSESIDDERLDQIAKILGVTRDAIKYYNEDAVIFHIENMNDNASNYQFNPLDKVVELYDKLLQSKDELLQQKDDLLKQKDEIIEMYKEQLKS